MTPLAFDHVAVVAPTLEAGIAHVHATLGVEVPAGGAHPQMGTKNRLMRLGDTSFFEIIAVDPDAEPPSRPRWFELDHAVRRAPRLAHWLLNTPNIDATLEEAGALLGEAVPLTRGSLSWRISVPADGSLPLGGAFPSVLQWPSGPHPASGMADLGCRLQRLHIVHPEADRVATFLHGRFADPRVRIEKGDRPGLRALIDTPDGARWLA